MTVVESFAALGAALLIPVLASGDGSTPPSPAAQTHSRVAAPAPGHPGSRFPRRLEWGFETTDERGRELFAMEEVPLFLGDRATQPDWVQRFGARADPSRSDRFPREPAATFSAAEAWKGRRSLHLQSRGDCALVQLARAVPVTGGLAVRLAAWVKLRGLKEGALRIQVRSCGGDSNVLGRLESPHFRGDQDWKEVEMAGQVPEGTESLMVEFLLEGSYVDGETHAWIDSLELVLEPGLRIDFGRRRLLLFGDSDREIPFEFQARGVPPGGYGVEVKLERLGLDGEPLPGEPLVCRTSRYAAAPDSLSPAGPSGGAPSLRFRGDLRQVFPGMTLPAGPLRLRIGLRSLGGSPADGAMPVGERSERLGLLPGPSGVVPARGVRLGIAFTDGEIRGGSLDVLSGLPAGFPLAEVLWDLVPGWNGAEAPAPPPEIRLPGERAPLPWRGRFGPDFLRDGNAPSRLHDWSHRIRSWEALVDPKEPEAAGSLRRIREGSDFLALGSPAAAGERPAWSSFQVFEVGGAPGPGAGAGSPEVQDWTIAEVRRGGNEREEFSQLSRLLLDLVRAGHARIFLRSAIDLLSDGSEGGRRSPRLAAFAWAGLGRLLAGGPVREDYAWDPRGLFIAVPCGTESVLITMARGQETFRRDLWTGTPLRGADLFGNEVPSPFDEATGRSEILVGPDPVVYRGFDPALLATVQSLAQSGPGLRLTGGEQEAQFTMKNRTEEPLSLRFALKMPEGFLLRGGGGPRQVEPGGETTFRVPMRVPENFALAQVKASLELSIEGRGRKCLFLGERPIEVRSEFLRLLEEDFDPEARRLSFTVESLAQGALVVRLYCRVVVGGSQDSLESWEERIPPLSRRTFALDLDLPPSGLEGKEVLIGAEVRGKGEFLEGRYHLKSSEGKLRLLSD